MGQELAAGLTENERDLPVSEGLGRPSFRKTFFFKNIRTFVLTSDK